MTKRIAIIGGGIAGLTAAWQLAQLAHKGAGVEATLFESSPRLGGIVETVHRDGFTIECGPDAWVTEKPWARELALELGLEHHLLPSNDAGRKTHILLDGHLQTMPDGMRMMVPTDLAAIDASPLFSASAKQAFQDELTRAAELRDLAPHHDESIASFTRRHFGEEVLARIAAPLLSGVFGGSVEYLSVQAVMPQFVAMEREYGSLMAALRARTAKGTVPVFTTLRSGLGTLIDSLQRQIPPTSIERNTPVEAIARTGALWHLRTSRGDGDFDELFLAVPPHVAEPLLRTIDPGAADLLRIPASSSIIVAFAFTSGSPMELPPGFGFLVPPSAGSNLLACTFVDQKFAARVPPGGRLLRAFFGGEAARDLLDLPDEQLVALARRELTPILGQLPEPAFTLVRRWPHSLPQYGVGHLTRMAELDRRIAALPGLTLLGNAYRGVGLPDLIRDSRHAARRAGQL